MKIHIKNMVCNRCKMVVQSELEKLGLTAISVELGEVQLSREVSKEMLEQLNNRLLAFGFELIDDRKSRTVEKVKNLITELVHCKQNQIKTNLSDYIVDAIHQDYSYISSLFSQVESKTIEQYYILSKIERVKELIVYDEFTLSEIAFELNYSSTSHLSKQFKKVTGLTVTHFRNLKEQKRQPLDNL